MTKHDDGGPAFPSSGFELHHGMTLWDYFAAHALVGYWADGRGGTYAGAAEFAADSADAMIAERKKRMGDE